VIRRPRFKPHFNVVVDPPDAVYLLTEREHFALSGRLYVLVAPLLDGQRTSEAVVACLKGKAEPEEVYYALGLLEARGYLAEGRAGADARSEAFWSGVGVGPDAVAPSQGRLDARLVALPGMDAGPMAAALDCLGVGVSDQAGLTVVLTSDYLDPDLSDLNRGALAAGRPWLILKPAGTVLWLGPLFRPGATGCWECLATRLRANREVERFLQTREARFSPFPASDPALPSSLQAACHLAAIECVRALAQPHGGPLDGRVVTLDLATLEMRPHVLVRMPHCPACGAAAGGEERTPVPVVLQSRRKSFTTDGGHRVCSPEATVARLSHHVSPITGVVASLTCPDPHPLVHVYHSGHNTGRPGTDLAALRSSLRSKSGGKGKSDAQARASALCEALERHSGIYRGDEPARRATFADMGEAAIHPNAVALFSEAQLQNRECTNPTASPFSFVFQPFDPAREVEWTPLWSLTAEEFRWLPTACCYYGYSLPEDHRFFRADSNGNAAGNTLEEAVLQGFMELVERDAVAVWWYNRLQRPPVALESFDDPYIPALREHHRNLGRRVWALDLTHDLGVPVFAAVSARESARTESICLGFGAHFDPGVALLRALTEANQMLAADRRLGKEDHLAGWEPDVRGWFETASQANQPYVVPADGAAPREASDFAYEPCDDLLEDIRRCIEITCRHGLELQVLDQTRAEIGLPVVKVVVPGLRHFWPRLAPGRLYEVPVNLGWLPTPRREEELNPIPVFF
jgi:bacteriocin biosynthesis cyclodehydratase domain-containing protein